MPIAAINGTMLHYHVHGKGTPIVFIHPPLLASANFRYQQVQLSDEFQVVTFDIRGHGHSAPSKAPVTYDLIVEDIKQLMDFLGIEKAYVCGYSTGGSIALEAMLTHPERFLGGILVSAMSEVSDFFQKNRIRLAVGLSGWKAAFPLLMLGISWGNADSMQTFRNLVREARAGNPRNIRQYYRYSLRYNCTKRLSDIKAPVLLLYGDKDRGFKRYRKLLQQKLPRHELHVIKKMKHQLPTKAAAEMNEVIRRWLRRLHRAEEAERSAAPTEASPFPDDVAASYVPVPAQPDADAAPADRS